MCVVPTHCIETTDVPSLLNLQLLWSRTLTYTILNPLPSFWRPSCMCALKKLVCFFVTNVSACFAFQSEFEWKNSARAGRRREDTSTALPSSRSRVVSLFKISMHQTAQFKVLIFFNFKFWKFARCPCVILSSIFFLRCAMIVKRMTNTSKPTICWLKLSAFSCFCISYNICCASCATVIVHKFFQICYLFYCSWTLSTGSARRVPRKRSTRAEFLHLERTGRHKGYSIEHLKYSTTKQELWVLTKGVPSPKKALSTSALPCIAY